MDSQGENPYQSPAEPEAPTAAPAANLSKAERVLFGVVLALIAAMCLVLARNLHGSP